MDTELVTPKGTEGRLPKELAVYELLNSLRIPFWRIDHSAAMTMEDCEGHDFVSVELPVYES